MKKTALLLTLVLILSLVTTSCQFIGKITGNENIDDTPPHDNPTPEPMSAMDAWYTIDSAMDSVDSYESTIVLALSASVDDIDVHIEVDTHSVYRKDYLYEYATSTVTANDLETINESMTAYSNGFLFILNRQNGAYSRLYSEMTTSDFLEYQKNTDTSF